MAQRRARSADRQVAGEDGVDRMVELLGQLLNQRPAPREIFKAPDYDGSTDVEYFIQQFSEVSIANEWTDGAALLHLRARLKEDARDCGQGHNLDAVFTALRARFGMSAREARTKLANLRRKPQTSLHSHAIEVERLVQLAYADVPAQHRHELAIETFCSTLGHTQLQRHLLAIQTPDLQAAVRAGSEFLQIQPTGTSSGIRMVESDEQKAAVQAATTDPIQQLLKAMTELTREVALLKDKQIQKEEKKSREKHNRCFKCNQEGHWKRQCPQTERKETSSGSSGNEKGPQQ